MLDRQFYYKFDSHLDDSEPWSCSIFTCKDCMYTFIGVYRMDQPEPTCPRCVTSDRWVKRTPWHGQGANN